MLEFMTIASIIFFGLVILTLFAIIGFVLKLVLKVVLLPLTLVFWILKGVLLLVGLVLALVFAPIAIAVLLLALPFFLLAGLFGLGWAVFA